MVAGGDSGRRRGGRQVTPVLRGRASRDSGKVVTGTAFKIYLTMLSRGSPMGVRELQHAVGLRSASTVKYHLDRLKAAGLVRQLPDGRYEAIKSGNPLLTGYVFIMNTPVPRLLPVSLAYAAFIISYSILSGSVNPVLLASSVGFAAYVFAEALRLKRLLKYLSGE